MLPDTRKEIGLITVNYNSAEATAQLLADLRLQDTTTSRLTVVVADTSRSAETLASLRALHRDEPEVRFLSMEDNPGYFGAAARALRTVWGEDVPDWIIVSNADVRLPRQDLLARIAELPAGEGVGVVAPRVLSGRTGLDQNPYLLRRPRPARIYCDRIIHRVPLLYSMVDAQYRLKGGLRGWWRRSQFGSRPVARDQSCAIYAPHGSFLIFARAYFEGGGNLDAGAFLYAEEIFVAETCRRLSLDVLYVPTLEVGHDEHVSTGNNPAVRHFLAEASDYCFREFFAKRPN